MDKYAKVLQMLKQATKGPEALPLVPVEVKEITGESCTVTYGDLELTEVRLKATINGSGDKLLQVPKVGSMVLIGSLTGDFKDLAVLKIDEVERLQYNQNGLKVEIDATTGKLSVSNHDTSLKDLFQQLVDLLKVFKVQTPSGVSTVVVPDTLQAIVKFETDFKKILN